MMRWKHAMMGSLAAVLAGTMLASVACELPQTLTRPQCKPQELVRGLCMNKDMDQALAQTACPEMQVRYEQVVRQAKAYLDRIPPAKHKVVIADLDETLVSNLAYYRDNKRYNPQAWPVWVRSNHEAGGPYYASVLKLLQVAKARGFSVMFITGRSPEVAYDTLAQVNAIAWDGVFFRPFREDLPSRRYKAQVREMLRRCGYEIVLNIGDQTSDLEVPADPKRGQFLLPNVMYSIP